MVIASRASWDLDTVAARDKWVVEVGDSRRHERDSVVGLYLIGDGTLGRMGKTGPFDRVRGPD